MSFDLCQHFSQYFSLELAHNNALRDEVYRIRYEVYCEELQYESPANFPDGLEKDSYDDHSIHYLLKHKSTGNYAGCVRMIMPCNKDKQLMFPWQEFSSSVISPYSASQWIQVGEISRLAVRGQFRKRKEDGELPIGSILPDNSRKRRFPLITMSLYWVAACLALHLELELIAIMQPRLARHLKKCGLRYYSVSDLFEFHGKRAMFLIKPPELIENLEPDTYKFFDYVNRLVANDLRQYGSVLPIFEAGLETQLSLI